MEWGGFLPVMNVVGVAFYEDGGVLGTGMFIDNIPLHHCIGCDLDSQWQ